MKRLQTILVGAICALCIFAAARADHDDFNRNVQPQPAVSVERGRYLEGDWIEISVRVDQPAWVQLYETDSRGLTRRLIHSQAGMRMWPGRPIRLSPFFATGIGRHQIIAIASYRPFRASSAPYMSFGEGGHCDACHGTQLCEFHTWNRGWVTGPSAMPATAVAVFHVMAPRRNVLHRPVVRLDWVSVHAAVYVSGRFMGYGPDVCHGLRDGWHRVTAVYPGGRSISRWVQVDSGSTPRPEKRVRKSTRGGR